MLDNAGISYQLPGSRHYLPILSTTLKSHIVDLAVSHTLTQVFTNKSSSVIPEAEYTFPLYESSAVTDFSALVGRKTIKGVVKEKSQAKAIYEEAKSAGEVAALFDQNTPDVFTTSVGNIPAASIVVVVIKYVHELKQDIEVDGIKLVIPTVIAPRYGAPPSGIDYHTGLGYSSTWRGCWKRFSKEVSDIGDAEGEGVSILVTATTSGPIRGIQSPTHPIAVTLGSHSAGDHSEFNPNKAQATLAINPSSLTNLDKDFTLLINATGMGNPRAFLAPHPTLQDTSTLVVTLVPRFILPLQRHEIVFVVDCSGSMHDKIGTVRSALNIFLASLPVGSYFNICSFGSSHSFLWPTSQKYSAETLSAAKAHVDSMRADLGDTQMVRPVSEVIKHRRKGMKTEVLLLTDGDIWDTQSLLDIINGSARDGSIRFFSLGVGDSVSHALVEGISRAGNGYSQTVSENGSLQKKVMRMLRAALTPHVNDWHIDWDGANPADRRAAFPPPALKPTVSLFDPAVDPDSAPAPAGHGLPGISWPKIVQAPAAIPPLFSYSRVTVYLIISTVSKPTTVSLCGSAHDSNASAVYPLKLEIPVQQLTSPGACLGLYCLAGRKLLQDLEEGRATYLEGLVDPEAQPTMHASLIEREGTRVGIEFGLASKWTSFVAAEADDGEELDQQPDDSSSDSESGEGFELGVQLQENRGRSKGTSAGSPVQAQRCSTGNSDLDALLGTAVKDFVSSPLLTPELKEGAQSFSDFSSLPQLQQPQQPALPATPATPITPATPASPTPPATPASPTPPATTSPASPVCLSSPFTPASPFSPWSPVTPASPFSPSSPVTPSGPVCLSSPITPASPFSLSSPVTPTGPVCLPSPITSSGPVCLSSPITPSGPVCLSNPVTPASPASPSSPVTSASPSFYRPPPAQPAPVTSASSSFHRPPPAQPAPVTSASSSFHRPPPAHPAPSVYRAWPVQRLQQGHVQSAPSPPPVIRSVSAGGTTTPRAKRRRSGPLGVAPQVGGPQSEGIAVALSKLQEFSGLFRLEPELLAVLGVSQAIVAKLAGFLDGSLLATMIVVKILRKKFTGEEWELMVEKASAAAATQFGAQEVERVSAAIDGFLV